MVDMEDRLEQTTDGWGHRQEGAGDVIDADGSARKAEKKWERPGVGWRHGLAMGRGWLSHPC